MSNLWEKIKGTAKAAWWIITEVVDQILKPRSK